jgi:hypothetical protein
LKTLRSGEDTCFDQKLLSRRRFILGESAFWRWPISDLSIKTIAVTRYTVPIKKLPAEFHGFYDFASNGFTYQGIRFGAKRFNPLIKQQNYDLIAMTGILSTSATLIFNRLSL